jgi:hypothetical protein
MVARIGSHRSKFKNEAVRLNEPTSATTSAADREKGFGLLASDENGDEATFALIRERVATLLDDYAFLHHDGPDLPSEVRFHHC